MAYGSNLGTEIAYLFKDPITMKKRNLPAIVFCTLIVFSACRPETAEPLSRDYSSESDNALAENAFNDILLQVENAVEENGLRDLCSPTVSFDTSATPRTITLDFGDVNCTALNGRTRRGRIQVSYTGRYRDVGTEIIITPEDYNVTHLQCTPSMARMIAMNDEARMALDKVRLMMVGGEALPGTLVAELGRNTRARFENMYGPTETTIWSSTETASAEEAVVNIGRPIANTQMYVLDEHLEPVAVGVPGELYIGGDDGGDGGGVLGDVERGGAAEGRLSGVAVDVAVRRGGEAGPIRNGGIGVVQGRVD